MRRLLRIGSMVWLAAACPAAAVTHESVIATGRAFEHGPVGAEVGSLYDLYRDAFTDTGWASLGLRLAIGPGGVSDANDEVLLRVAPDGTQQLIARQGDPAPGAPGRFLSGAPARGMLSDAGEMVFDTKLTGFLDAAYFVDAAGVSHLIAKEGDLAPGIAEPIYGARVRIGPDGTVVFGTNLDSAAGADRAALFVSDGAGGLALVAIDGMTAPGTGGLTFTSISNAGAEVNALGEIVFDPRLEDGIPGANAHAIYRWAGGSLDRVFASGDPKPGGGVFAPSWSGMRTNALGDVLFRTANAIEGGVWVRHADDSFSLLARNGDPVAAPPGAVLVQSWLDPILNDAGETAFAGWVDVAGAVQPAVFGPTPDGVAAVAVVGDPAPELPAGATIDVLGISSERGWLDDAGGIAFLAIVSGPGVRSSDDEILYHRAFDGTFRVIAREGQTVEVGPGDVRTIARLGRPPEPQDPPFHTTFVDLDGQQRALFQPTYADGSRGVVLADLRPARCDVEMSQASYANGDDVVIASLRFENLESASLPARLRLQLTLPIGITVDALDLGAGGGFALPPSFDRQLGPVTMFPLGPEIPLRGAFEWRCALEDPVTGGVIADDRAAFDLE